MVLFEFALLTPQNGLIFSFPLNVTSFRHFSPAQNKKTTNSLLPNWIMRF